MMAYWVSGVIAPHILIVGAIEGKWSASLPSPTSPGERTPSSRWIGCCMGPRAGRDAVVKGKIRCPCWESNRGLATCSLVTIWTELQGFSSVGKEVKSAHYIRQNTLNILTKGNVWGRGQPSLVERRPRRFVCRKGWAGRYRWMAPRPTKSYPALVTHCARAIQNRGLIFSRIVPGGKWFSWQLPVCLTLPSFLSVYPISASGVPSEMNLKGVLTCIVRKQARNKTGRSNTCCEFTTEKSNFVNYQRC